MAKNYSCFFLSFLIALLLAGCINSNVASNSDIDTSPPKENASPLQCFKDIMPNAAIENILYCDVDANGEDDCLILFTDNNTESPITAGLSVCLSNSLCSAIDLGGDDNLIFNSTASYSYNNNIPTISVQLKDPSSGTVYLYRVEYTCSSTTPDANYRVYSEILKGG